MSDELVYTRLPGQSSRSHGERWTPWIPDPLDKKPVDSEQPGAVSELSPEDTKRRLKSTLSRLRERAQQQGYDEGHAAGHTKGLEQGLAEGRKLGQEEGYRQGYETGLEEGREKAEEAARRLDALSQECAQALSGIETEMGQAMIALALRIAGQVLHQTLERQPENIHAVLDNMLRMDTGKSGVLQLHVSPDDLELVQEYLRDNPETRLWRIFPDESITRGGCKARTALGDIDATLETRWQRVVASIGGEP